MGDSNPQASTKPLQPGMGEENKPLVTAVLVCWNHANFVRTAVLSVLSQTYQRIQIIAIDNGSTDGSAQQLKTLAADFGFTLICQENIGLVPALNNALKMAKGKYFASLATDDIWLPDRIERQVAYLELNEDVQLLCGNVVAIDEHENEWPWVEGGFSPGEVTVESMLREKSVNTLGPTFMFRTSALCTMGGYDTRIRVEDYWQALRFANAGMRTVSVDEVFTKYRRHTSNWTATEGTWTDLLAMGKIFCNETGYPYREWLKKHHAGYFRWLAGRSKIAALRLLINEPIPWSWNDVGVGLVKILSPKFLNRYRISVKR